MTSYYKVFLMSLTMYLAIIASCLAWKYTEKLDYETHPCKRDCLQSVTPMTCYYNFTVEHYTTMSRACYDCPRNVSDCFRPHCITGDGNMRAIKVVNRMMPGPGIHVCKGDLLVVNVYNDLMNFEGTSIHWHGVTQQGTPHMDGVSMLTQCPISMHSSFQYRFKVDNPGTHYWHAHAGMQRGDGINGALVVRDTVRTEVMSEYDEDLPEHTVVIQEWMDSYQAIRFSLIYHSIDIKIPHSIIINGRATTFASSSDGALHDKHGDGYIGAETSTMASHDGHMMTSSNNHTTTSEPMEGDMGRDGGYDGDDDILRFPHTVFRVQKDKRYRFRLIYNGVINCQMKVSVADHKLTIIASDGYDVKPVTVDSINLFAGERYDVVLFANQNIGNYWMHVIGQGGCKRHNASQTAIIRYDSAGEMKPISGETYHDGDREGLTGNPVIETIRTITNKMVTVAKMESHTSPDDVNIEHGVKKFYLQLGYNELGNYRYLDPDHYPVSVVYEIDQGKNPAILFSLQINKITHTMPDMPALTQYGEIDESIYCNESSINVNCSAEFCECVHRLKVDVNDIVEFVLIGEGLYGNGNHPMHLHGHSFYVLGMDKLNTTIDRSTIEYLDSKGKLKRNLKNPVKKDTVSVPNGGYTIIRFKADNPGFWLFHCHVDFHMQIGFSIEIQVGEPHEMVRAPASFPRCGSWSFTGESSDDA